MIRWSYTLTRIANIDVRIHLTFLLFLGIMGLIGLLTGGLPAAIASVLFIAALFGCVLLHEFGHALAAARYGIRTPDITLLPIGGVARLERMPSNPKQELVIALAGPMVNVVIAGLLMLLLGGLPNAREMFMMGNPIQALLAQLAWVNIILVAFNMLPAFPMDGGRVLRALLALRMPHSRATDIAAKWGQFFAGLLFVAGLFWSPILLFTAVFVFLGARREAAYARQQPIWSEPEVEIIPPGREPRWFDREEDARFRPRPPGSFESRRDSHEPRVRRVVFHVR